MDAETAQMIPPRGKSERFPMAKVLLANPGMLRVKPAASRFMAGYMGRFPVRRFGDNLILHSHLPSLTSRAYSRFVSHHLVARADGPSHAQIGITDRCPQNCEYCYNKGRRGEAMDTATILRVIDDLREAGVAWLGLTGGEPLLNPDIVQIVRYASRDMAVKLFTTGMGLTPRLASDLAEAGLMSVAVSLDHWEPERHDASRRYPGAYTAALAAIRMFKQVPGLHVSVSSVISRDMLQKGRMVDLLSFLSSLGIDEAWLSEVKPSGSELMDDGAVISEPERRELVKLQDDWNHSLRRRGAAGGMTINYLGHFEGAENFGCNAGRKMVYVDAHGEVSPCVFLPMSFGNVRERPLGEILAEMRALCPGERCCFVNKNHRLLGSAESGAALLDREGTTRVLRQAEFGAPSDFNKRLLDGRAA